MKRYIFLVAHGYEIMKGYVCANDKKQATTMILNKCWDDIIDEYETDEFTEGYEILEIIESV